MSRTIENYKTRKYRVIYSWYSYGEKYFDMAIVHAKTKKAVYGRLRYDGLFDCRNEAHPGIVQIEKVTWIRPPKPEDKENG